MIMNKNRLVGPVAEKFECWTYSHSLFPLTYTLEVGIY